MAGAFTRRPDSDPSGISEWLAQKGVGTLKTADGVIDYRFCQGCGRRLSKVAIGLTSRKFHCSPACRHRAFRKRHGLPSYEGPTHGRRRGQPPPVPKIVGPSPM
jgi:hypothetical protein